MLRTTWLKPKGFFKDEGLEVEFIQINPRLGAMAVLNGDVTFTTSFVSTFRGIVQGLPMKTVFILLKKGMYYLMVRPDLIKDIQDLKGKKLGVTAVNGGDHIIGRELLRMKGRGSEPGSSDRRRRSVAKVSSGRHRCGAGCFGTTAV